METPLLWNAIRISKSILKVWLTEQITISCQLEAFGSNAGEVYMCNFSFHICM